MRQAISLNRATEHQGYFRLAESQFAIDSSNTDQLLPEDFQKFVRSYRPCPRVLRTFDNAILVGDGGLVFTQEGRPVIQITRPDAVLRRKLPNLVSSRSSILRNLVLSPKTPTYALSGYYLPMVYLWSHNYYHWVVEFLPKLRSLQQFESETGELPKILIQSDPPEWMVESLQFFGLNEDRIQEWKGEATQISKLLLSSHRITTGGQHGSYDLSLDDHEWVRNTILSNLADNTGRDTDERIYISRQRAGRRVKNFDEILSVLEEYGFQQYVLEELSFREQVRLFSAADHIVAPHGAGLTNILFAPTTATVTELLPSPRSNSNFFRIAAMLGQQYSYIDCKTSYDPEAFTVETDQLSEQLKKHVGPE